MNNHTFINNHRFIFYALITINLVGFFLFYQLNAFAQSEMSNDKFNIEQPQIEYEETITNKANITINPIESDSKYEVISGSSTKKTKEPLKFSLSSTIIDFGPLTPGEPVTRTNTIKSSSGSSYGYVILAIQDHPLRDLESATDIPDTTCDTGICSEKIASKWINLTTFGYGYRCDSQSTGVCDSNFEDSTFFKQFSSSESGQLAQPIISSLLTNKDIESQITYKVNISTSQKTGTYKNNINLFLVPAY